MVHFPSMAGDFEWGPKGKVIDFLTRVMVVIAVGCGATPPPVAPVPAELVPVQLPSPATSAPHIENAYRIAATVPSVLEQIKCYCFCNDAKSGGKHNNLKECFIEPNGDFNVRHKERHTAAECSGMTCGLCVLEAREVWALLQQGKKVPEIREYIDKTYDPSAGAHHH